MAQHLVCQIPDRSQCIQSRKFFAMKRGLMLLWFKDFMNVTEKLQFINLMLQHCVHQGCDEGTRQEC